MTIVSRWADEAGRGRPHTGLINRTGTAYKRRRDPLAPTGRGKHGRG